MTSEPMSPGGAVPPPVRAMLESLAIPEPEELPPEIEALSEGHEWRDAARFVTHRVARDLWREWNPRDAERIEDPAFLRAFRSLLRDGAALGLRLDRFREGSASLPEPDASGRSWIAFQERAIERADTLGFRLWLGPEPFQEYRRHGSAAAGAEESWQAKLAMMQDGLFYELGVILPPIAVAADEGLAGTAYRCEWNDLRLPPRRGLPDGKVLVNDTPERLRLLNIAGEPAVNPANGNPCALVDRSYADLCEQAGLTTWDARGFAILGISAAIRDAAGAFVVRPFTDLCLLRLGEFDPELVALVDAREGRDFLTQLLRGLLAEEISVRDLSRILNWYVAQRATCSTDLAQHIVFAVTDTLLADRGIGELGPQVFVEHARICLKRYVSHKYTRGQNTLIVYLLDPELEEFFRRRDELGPAERRIVLQAVREEVGSLPSTAQVPVILTTLEIRHRVRTAIYPEIPNLAVLSYQELSPDLNIQPIARISAPDLAHAPFFRMLEGLPGLTSAHAEPAVRAPRASGSVGPSLADRSAGLELPSPGPSPTRGEGSTPSGSSRSEFNPLPPAGRGWRVAPGEGVPRSDDDRVLFEYLILHRDRVAQGLYTRFNQGRPVYAYTAVTERIVRDLLEAVLDGVLELLATGQTDRLDRLLRYLAAPGTGASGVASPFLRVPLDLASVVRELIAADDAEPGTDDAAARILPLLERLDGLARTASELGIDPSSFQLAAPDE